MSEKYRFDRLELSGSLGDLGTLLPIAMGIILINGLNPLGLFFSIGVFYILSGMYFRVTVPVQPMKVIGAYAIAMALSPQEILASTALMAVFLFIIGITGIINLIGKYTPKPAIRGVQLATGSLLMSEGVSLVLGDAKIQQIRETAEPYLAVSTLGPVPIGLVIGLCGAVLTLCLLENRKLPAGLVVIVLGLILGSFLGTHQGLGQLSPNLHLPGLMPFEFPGQADFTFALLALVLPQLPMTVGNAVFAYTDLSREYFGVNSHRVSNRAACISMALANAMCFLLGGMPLCHGAGGLAAHYRFGARTAGSNIIIGSIFLVLAIVLGNNILYVLFLIPMAILGVLLLFAGLQLALTILDVNRRRDMFVCLLILGITLASNLAAGFLAGVAVYYLLEKGRVSV